MGAPPRGRSRQFARRLKNLRLRNRLTLEEVCAAMRFSTSKLNRIENAHSLVDIHELKSLLDLYCVTADRWPEYFEMLDAAGERGWWRAYGLDDKGYVPLEADASEVRDFTLAYIPGLLQTADYARAIFRASVMHRSPDQLNRELAVRMIRQRRLTSKDDPIQLVSVIDESVLRRPVGGARVLAGQLAHLLEASGWATVSIQVLPNAVGAHPSMAGVFSILSFGDLGEPDLVYVEHPLGSTQSEKDADVATATLRFDRLRSDALSPADSVALIRRAAERLTSAL